MRKRFRTTHSTPADSNDIGVVQGIRRLLELESFYLDELHAVVTEHLPGEATLRNRNDQPNPLSTMFQGTMAVPGLSMNLNADLSLTVQK